MKKNVPQYALKGLSFSLDRFVNGGVKRVFLLAVLISLFQISYGQSGYEKPRKVVGELIRVIPSLKDFIPGEDTSMITRTEQGLISKKTWVNPVVDFGTKAKGDPVVQINTKKLGNSATTSPDAGTEVTQNFDGMGYTSVAPADPTMTAGPNHIIQMINGGSGGYFKIWDRNGVQVVGQTYMDLLTGAAYSGAGDPVALYDQFSGRYMLTEFGYTGGVTSYINTLIVAVSQTSDPAGGWYIYRFQDNNFFVDYPHWGVWPDAIYATSNDFNTGGTAYLGSSIYALNKAKMLTGDVTAELIRVRFTSTDNKFISTAPISISGPTPPAAGSPGMFMYYNDDNYTASATDVDSLGIITMQPNFTTPANTVITFAQQLVAAPFKSNVCTSRNCVPSGGSAGYDALSNRFMNRIYYRNFGSYEALVASHTVDANYPGAAKSGVRWYELRRNGGAWSIFQQSTYAPDADHRWMGSININSKGQIALAYNHSGAGKYASIYFAGRNSTDPPGTMAVNDVLLKQGTAYGTFSNRWGDYNDLPNDVVNDSIFWFTAMYGSGASSWSTRVSSFKIGLCTPSVSLALTQAGTVSVPEGTNIVYTNTVNAVCDPINGYTLTDTLPTTVTWVSGGSYNPANRVVTFSPVNVAADASSTYTYTVNVNAGTYFPPAQHINDAGTALAPNWTATSTTANVWGVSTASFRSAPSSFFTPNASVTSDQILTSTGSFALSNNPSATHSLSFWHRFDAESGWDGGVVEISTNGGTTWTDLGPFMSGLTYTGVLGTGNPIAGRSAFTGNSGGSFAQTRINLNSFAGQTIKIRFRFVSDGSFSNVGWYVDDILLQSAPVVNMRTSLFNASNVRIAISDTVTQITQAPCTELPVVTAPTVTQPTCGGQLTGTIVVNATGSTAMEYSINNGTTWQASNTFNNLAAGNYTIVVRFQAATHCQTVYASNPVVISPLAGTPTISNVAVTQPLCPVLTGTIVVTASGTGTLEYSVNGGTSWQTSNTFNLLAAGTYNVVVREQSNPGCLTNFSGNPVTINTVIPPQVTTQPVNRIICQNGNTTFTIADNAPLPAPTYQWQISTNGGTTWTNLSNVAPFTGTTTTTLTLTTTGIIYNGNLFRCAVTNVCGTTFSNSASLTVNPIPVVNSGPSGFCAPVTLTANGNANTWSWSPATGLNTTTGTTVIASPTVSTVYTVTGTITATGCTNTASVTVLGTPATPVITPAAPVICAGTIQPLTVTPTTFTYTYTGTAITIPTTASPANPYPAILNVTGLPTSGVRVKSVTLNGVTHTWPTDIDALVQSPTGTNVVVMSDVGGISTITGRNYTFDDAAPVAMSTNTEPSGTYKPSNVTSPDTWIAPGPGSVDQSAPALSSFTGNFNGDWKLFIVDDGSGDGGSVNSWTITFEIPTAVWTPVTGLFTDANATNAYVAGTPASTVYFKQSPTTTTQYTYSVTNTLGTCSSGPASVTVTVNPLPTVSVSPTGQCGPVTLNATGTSTAYSWSPAAGLSATTGASVTANPALNTTYTVTGSITATGCTATATALVNATPPTPVVTPSAVNLCLGSTTTITVAPYTASTSNAGPIAIPNGAPANTASGVAGPYPSAINVGGLPASGVRVKSVTLNGVNHTWPSDIDMLLQAPNGSNVILMSDRGGSADIVNATLVFDDAAATDLPNANIVSGTYKPTNVAGPDVFTAPGPGSVNQINPRLANFTGNFNGDWKLFIVDQAAGDVGAITSWSITFEVNGAVWTPVTGLFTDANTQNAYVAGTMAATLYAKPTTTTTYTATRSTVTCTSGSATSVVTVFQPAVITTQPANVTLCAGANATFSVVATGSSLSYQWQLSTDNGTTWANITGENSATLTIANTTTALSGRRYRVIINNTCNSVTSSAATLTVNAPTPVTATDLWNRRICISDTLVPLVGTPVGGSWSGIGVSGFNFIPGATAVGTYTLTYSYTNAAGCTSTDTTKAVVSDCPERIRLLRDDAVILYPNPNSGQFFIRMNSVLYNYLSMRVYTSAGQLVSTQDWKGLVYGRVVPINLTHLPAAVYMVRFIYDDGVRTSEKTFRVVIGGQ